MKAKEDALYSFEKMHESDKKKTPLEFRVYDVSDDVDVLDSDAVADAICDCYGYDEF